MNLNQFLNVYFRGSHHKRVPDISDRPFNTLLPVMKDGRNHPEPYYMTKTVT